MSKPALPFSKIETRSTYDYLSARKIQIKKKLEPFCLDRSQVDKCHVPKALFAKQITFLVFCVSSNFDTYSCCVEQNQNSPHFVAWTALSIQLCRSYECHLSLFFRISTSHLPDFPKRYENAACVNTCRVVVCLSSYIKSMKRLLMSCLPSQQTLDKRTTLAYKTLQILSLHLPPNFPVSLSKNGLRSTSVRPARPARRSKRRQMEWYGGTLLLLCDIQMSTIVCRSPPRVDWNVKSTATA
jgi:hypothetical protein